MSKAFAPSCTCPNYGKSVIWVPYSTPCRPRPAMQAKTQGRRRRVQRSVEASGNATCTGKLLDRTSHLGMFYKCADLWPSLPKRSSHDSIRSRAPRRDASFRARAGARSCARSDSHTSWHSPHNRWFHLPCTLAVHQLCRPPAARAPCRCAKPSLTWAAWLPSSSTPAAAEQRRTSGGVLTMQHGRKKNLLKAQVTLPGHCLADVAVLPQHEKLVFEKRAALDIH